MAEQEKERALTFADIVQREWKVHEHGDVVVHDTDGSMMDWVCEIFGWVSRIEGRQLLAEDYARLITNAPVMYRILKAVVDPNDFVATKTIVALLNRIEGKESE